jgi:hypothetical protein
VLHNKSRDTANLVCSKAAIGHKRHRLQPELGHVPLTLHMDVRRFPAVGAEENETVRSITKYGRHRAALLAHMFPHSEERFYAEKRKVATEAERPKLSRADHRRSIGRLLIPGVGCSVLLGGAVAQKYLDQTASLLILQREFRSQAQQTKRVTG